MNNNEGTIPQQIARLEGIACSRRTRPYMIALAILSRS